MLVRWTPSLSYKKRKLNGCCRGWDTLLLCFSTWTGRKTALHCISNTTCSPYDALAHEALLICPGSEPPNLARNKATLCIIHTAGRDPAFFSELWETNITSSIKSSLTRHSHEKPNIIRLYFSRWLNWRLAEVSSNLNYYMIPWLCNAAPTKCFELWQMYLCVWTYLTYTLIRWSEIC